MVNHLPNGWIVTTLGEVASYQNGRAFKPSEWRPNGIPIIRIQNLNNNAASFNYSDSPHEDKFAVRNGDLLFAWSASLGAHIWRGETAWLNQHIFRVDHGPEVNRLFLYYALKNTIAELYTKAHGSGMVHVTKRVFLSTPFWLPPLAEQHRIVAKIDVLFKEIDKGAASLRSAKKLVQLYRQSLLKSAFEGRLTAKWRQENADKLESPVALLASIHEERERQYQVSVKDREKAIAEWNKDKKCRKPVKPKSSRDTPSALGSIDKSGWATCRIGEVLLPVQKTGKHEKNRLIWYVDIASIDNQDNQIRSPKRMNLVDAPSRARQKIRTGDVLFSTVRPYLRNIAQVEHSLNGEIASTGFAVLRGAKGINPKYLFYKSISYDFVSALTGEQYGVSYPAIKEEQVRDQTIELPSTEEQAEIVQILDVNFQVAAELSGAIDSALAKAVILRQSILKR
ncbi:MAG: restriction endonuclease subunit S, partial [Gammaproteobacteria bacterium]|nr:restriction endonuclease subunit S [Gammaproteobacteria bacterium]